MAATPFLLPALSAPALPTARSSPNPSPSLFTSWHPKLRHSCKPPAAARPASAGDSLLLAKADLLDLISDQERGVRTEGNPSRRAEIVRAVDALAAQGKDMVTTGPSLSGTWRMLWTTEKEQLFIIKNAHLFGTETGDVLQVLDVERGLLNNVITFPPAGVFFVRSTCEAVSPQRVNFRFTSAVLRGDNWQIPLPPFGQGWLVTLKWGVLMGGDLVQWQGCSIVTWRSRVQKLETSLSAKKQGFESVYLDEDIRVVKDIRGDYLVVDRAPYSWKE